MVIRLGLLIALAAILSCSRVGDSPRTSVEVENTLFDNESMIQDTGSTVTKDSPLSEFSPASTCLSELSEIEAFERLQSLVGKWKRVDDDILEIVTYRMTARNSALVETWNWPDRGSEAMTIYHMDGNKLMATHYCPKGNQPRLLHDPDDDESKFTFKFHSATNLPDRKVSHCVEFWIQLNDENAYTRSESYQSKDGVDVSEHSYTRTPSSEN